MNKREFINDICKLGMCSCTLGIMNPNIVNAKTNDDCDEIRDKNLRFEWRINHAKNQFGIQSGITLMKDMIILN